MEKAIDLRRESGQDLRSNELGDGPIGRQGCDAGTDRGGVAAVGVREERQAGGPSLCSLEQLTNPVR